MRADAVRNRQKLLSVAEKLFTKKGADVEMDEIAAEAGLAVGTIYRNFATKEALLEAIVVGPIEELIAEAHSLADASEPGEAFFAIFRKLVSLASAKHHLVAEFASAGLAATYGSADAVASRRDRFRKVFGKLLERAQAAGAVRADIRVPELFAIVNGAFTYLARDQAGRAAHRRLLALVLRAVATGDSQ